tara:strand:+ start:97 stop:507 length:411 start_codon:yes stop_codon:yes gene_type:complete
LVKLTTGTSTFLCLPEIIRKGDVLRKTTVKKYSKTDFERFMNSGQNHTETKTIAKENGYKIEKNVPVPEFRKVSRYPLLHLEVGDSFTAPVSEVKMVRSAITRTHRITNKAYKFITRTVHGRGRAGKLLRVWRVAG